MSETPREIDLSIEVPGTPEEVWQAIATGPGISSWYVPHDVEERSGGAMHASFGAAPEMQVEGRVAAWEPPRRVVFDGGDGVPGLAFEWLVEAREGGTCVVRLVNSGFGDGAPWDDQYDAMHEGWTLFLLNLRLHLEHFRGRAATAALPTGWWQVSAEAAWGALTEALGLTPTPGVGETVTLDGGGAARLVGTVVDAADHRLALVLEEPAEGTAFVVAEGQGGSCGLSIWAYLYGDDQARLADSLGAAWQEWLDAHAPAPA